MSRNIIEDSVQLPFHATSTSYSAPRRSSSLNQHGRPRIVTPPDSSLGNLNRWSRSTTSSTQSHQRSSSASLGRSKQDSRSHNSSPSSKLQKKRPSPAPNPTPQLRNNTPHLESNLFLPPINTLPSLHTSVANGTSPLNGPFTPSPSTAQVLSALPKSVPDYFSAWDEQSRDFSLPRTHSQSESVARDRSPTTSTIPISSLNDNVPRTRGHSRHRSHTTKSSTGTASSNRSSKQPSQKAMLSKALQKANTAVLLDNAQNFEGAMQAYSEACSLLQQVMARSSGDEDRRKLEAIRNTYTSRIAELTKIAPHLRDDGKALPARPESGDYRLDSPLSPDDDDDPAIIETATITRIVNDQSFIPEVQPRQMPTSQLPQRRESLMPAAMEYGRASPFDSSIGRSYSKSPMREQISEADIDLAPPIDTSYLPPPLSPRRPLSPTSREDHYTNHERQLPSDFLGPSANSPLKGHRRAPSNESMSWLDTIDESGGSTPSSIHSRTSSLAVRRKHIRAPSGATEAEFDAALDAAVEAAYDDGYEPDELDTNRYGYDDSDEVVANVRRKVELAKERVRQSEREAAIQDALDKERRRLQQLQAPLQDLDHDDYDGYESEEEERMLEEMTRGYVLDDFEFGLQSKSALPRESDSSGFSGRTWNSSIGSNLATTTTSLSTVAEGALPQVPPLQSKTPPPLHPPPSQALPPPPNVISAASQGVRSRRLSGQNAKQLKIETTTRTSPVLPPPPTEPPTMPPPRIPDDLAIGEPKTSSLPLKQSSQSLIGRATLNQTARQVSSPYPGASPTEITSPPTPNLTQVITNDSDSHLPRSGSPARSLSRSGLRKNYSSSSLKNLKGRNLSVTAVDDGSDASPNTPMSSQFAIREFSNRVPAMPALPTPIATAFKDKIVGGNLTGGLYLFNSDLNSPGSPGSPNVLNGQAPIPLEPCPTEFLLRPFWLMRALYQTIAHPRGGYISTKLFIPRDVWKVKGVKLKAVEDKIANCDFLTAALLKLAQVNTLDADAVLEEMQAFESTLEQVQTTLTKKLGSEVGVQGSGGLFKDSTVVIDPDGSMSGPKSAGATSKSSSFSWRRLRAKNSAVGLSNNYSNKVPSDASKDSNAIATLPMTTTSLAKVRFSKRDVGQLQFTGPNANYMNSLARLFDAAQTLDQIARQVEDPGLRHADKTQVGLELCTRHAAEFFGFFICRFVLNDVGLLLDKFIKRGSEWVLV